MDESFDTEGDEGEDDGVSEEVENPLPDLEGARGVIATTDPDTGEPIISSGMVGKPYFEDEDHDPHKGEPGRDSPDEVIDVPMNFVIQTKEGKILRGSGLIQHTRSSLNASLGRTSTKATSKKYRRGWDAVFGNGGKKPNNLN